MLLYGAELHVQALDQLLIGEPTKGSLQESDSRRPRSGLLYSKSFIDSAIGMAQASFGSLLR